MRISVLLPTLYPNLAERAVKSLRDHGMEDVELEIVICSPTPLAGEGVKWVEDADPSGNNAAIRKALDAATGDYILSFSDDAIALPGWLKMAVESVPEFWTVLAEGRIISLNHGAVGTCFGRLYANFPFASRATVERHKTDYYPMEAHWGDVSFSMAVYEAAGVTDTGVPNYGVFVTGLQVVRFEADRMGNGESGHRTSSFMRDTTRFVQRFASTLGQGWPMSNFRQYNIDLPFEKVPMETRTINEPNRGEFIKKYLGEGIQLGDWLDGGMWLMPTHQKFERCQKTLDAIMAVGTVTKGLVWINGGDQPGYENLRLPPNWRSVKSKDPMPVCEMYRRFYVKNKDLKWYGVIPDDVYPTAGGWDVELVQHANDRYITSGNDMWQNGENGNPLRMHGAMVFGGELIRKIGGLCIDGLQHNCFDDLWETLGRELSIWRFLKNVVTPHDHPWKNGDQSKEEYQRTLKPLGEDRNVFNAWFQRRHQDYGQIKDLYPNIRATPVNVAGKKVLIAVPCHDGKPDFRFVQSLMASIHAFMTNGVHFDLMFLPGESLIMRARNAIIKTFLDRDCTHLWMVDADMSWEPDAIIRLLSYGKDVVAAAGPRKQEPLTYCVNMEGPTVQFDDATGLIKAREVGAAFMVITRACAERMVKAYGPELSYTDLATNVKYIALFDTRLQDGYMWSEDYVFCQRWRQLGGEVFVDARIRLGHIGRKEFAGSLIDAMQAVPAQPVPQTQGAAAE